jgi:hypothetical protein
MSNSKAFHNSDGCVASRRKLSTSGVVAASRSRLNSGTAGNSAAKRRIAS